MCAWIVSNHTRPDHAPIVIVIQSERLKHSRSSRKLACYTAVFSVVTQRSSPLTLVTSTRFLSVKNNEANSGKKITHFKISLRYYYLVGLINE